MSSNNPYNPYNPYQQMGQNQMGQNQMGQNQMGQNQMGQNQMGQNNQYQQMPQNQMPQNQMPQMPLRSQMANFGRPQDNLVGGFQATRQLNTGINFVKFLGPRGEEKWDSVSIGYKSIVRAYILPPSMEGQNIFTISKKHFWKSHKNPRGTSITCVGENCPICRAKRFAIDSGNLEIQKRAKEFGAIRTQYLYNVAMLDNIQGHFDGGAPKPFVLSAGARLHTAIGNLVEDRGINICDPVQGRPIRLKKEKTGPSQMDVEYHATDEEPSPLPQALWPVLANLNDLNQLISIPKEEDFQMAILDMGLLDNSNNSYTSHPSTNQNYILNPPPVNSGGFVNSNYLPQPSHAPQYQVPQAPQAPQYQVPQAPQAPQYQVPQAPQAPQAPLAPQYQAPQGVIRQPISSVGTRTQQGQAPTENLTLEELQRRIMGNIGR